MNSKAPFISVLIPVYNRREALGGCLQALRKQTLPQDEFEVIVIDDGSVDSPEVLISDFHNSMNLRLIRQTHSNRAVALNCGIHEARGEILVFTDADMEPTLGWLEKHARFHKRMVEKNLAMLGYMDWHPDLKVTPFMKYIVGREGWQFAYNILEHGSFIPGGFFYGGNASLKRCFALENGVLDGELFRCEDVEYGYRMWKKGLLIVYDATAVNYHRHTVTLAAFSERNHLVGRAMTILISRYPEMVSAFGIVGKIVHSVEFARRGMPLREMIANIEALDRQESSIVDRSLMERFYGLILQSSEGNGMREGLRDNFEHSAVPCTVIVPNGEALTDSMEIRAQIARGQEKGYEFLILNPGDTLGSTAHPSGFPMSCFSPGLIWLCNAAAAKARGRFLCLLPAEYCNLIDRIPELVHVLEQNPSVGMAASSADNAGAKKSIAFPLVIPRPLYFECGGLGNVAGDLRGIPLSLDMGVRRLGHLVIAPEQEKWVDALKTLYSEYTEEVDHVVRNIHRLCEQKEFRKASIVISRAMERFTDVPELLELNRDVAQRLKVDEPEKS
jgi:glycosyltransferase involved in cell wall biosynthesis